MLLSYSILILLVTVIETSFLNVRVLIFNWLIILLLLLAKVELDLVKVEIYELHLLDHAVQKPSALLRYIFPELNHFSQTLSESNQFGEGGCASHLDVKALGVEWLKAAIDIQIENPVLELRTHARQAFLRSHRLSGLWLHRLTIRIVPRVALVL